jgi:branched-chain amino acid transport system substrate-binding protein
MNKTKKVLSLFAVLLALIVTFVFSKGVNPVQAAEPIKIGLICSITGWAGFLGTPQKDAMLAVVENINKKGGVLGRQIEVFVEDDKSNPTNAVIAASKLIRDINVSVIVGPTITDSGMAIMQTVEKAEVPYLVTTPVTSVFKKWVFLLGPGDARQAANNLYQSVNILGAKKIALIHDTANYGTTAAKILNEEVKKYPGVSFIIQEKCEVADTNMVPQLTKIKAANPDLLIVYTTGGPASVIAKNYKQLGMTTDVVCSGAVAMPQFLQSAGSIAEEYQWKIVAMQIIVAETLPMNDPYRKNVYEPFKKLYQNKYGKDKQVNIFHVGPPDAMTILVEALKAAGSDKRAAIRDALEKVKSEGLLGPCAFKADDHQGAPKDTAVLAVLKKGQIVPFYKKK